VGCGKKEEPGAGSRARARRSAPAPKPEPLKIAFAYVGPVGDGGWTFAHDNGRKAVEKEFGDKVVTSFVEKVPEAADAERVFRDLASQGNKLIFGTTFGYMEPMLKVAADLKDVKFEHATGYKQAENMRTYDSRTYEGAYMAGVIAGGMTKSNTLGVVGSIPIPEVIRNINSFTLGAQSVNPKVKTKVVWVNKWFDPPKETEAAQSLINRRRRRAVPEHRLLGRAADRRQGKKFAFGWDSDMSAYAPEGAPGLGGHQLGPVLHQGHADALEGKWTGGTGSWWGVKEGAIDIVSISDKVPAEIKAKVDAVKAGLKDGSFVIWKGPIVGQDGKEVLKKDEVADDKFLGGINFYVKGVEGKVPAFYIAEDRTMNDFAHRAGAWAAVAAARRCGEPAAFRRRGRCQAAQTQRRPLRGGDERAAHRRELPRPGALRFRARRLAG
jgi:basic membrane protein A